MSMWLMFCGAVWQNEYAFRLFDVPIVFSKQLVFPSILISEKKCKDLKLFELVKHITWSIVRHIAIRLRMLVVFARKQRGGKGTLSRNCI